MSSPPRVTAPHPRVTAPQARPAADPLVPAGYPAGHPLDNATKQLGPAPSQRPDRSRADGSRPGRPVDPPARTAAARFVDRFGWRAYALPVLVVITVAALIVALAPRPSVSAARRPASLGPARLPVPSPSRAVASVAPRAVPARPSASNHGVKPTARPQSEADAGDALPAGPDYTRKGTGTFHVVAGRSPVVGHGPLRKYVVEVENGVTGVDVAAFAASVVSTLSDARSWTAGGAVSLERVVSPGQADFRIALTSSITVRTLCGYEQKIETSCWENDRGPSQVNVNVARWVRGDAQFGQDLGTYRQYMINHEVGHALGHVHTFLCLPNGLAPVMMQQTITLKENQGQGPRVCRPNSWPFPPGVSPGIAVPS